MYPPELEGLIHWTEFCLVMACVSTLAFPALYAFSPWYKSALGRLVMLQSATLALAINLTAFFYFWTPTNLKLALVINAIVISAIAVTSALMTWMLWNVNHSKKRSEL